MLSIPFSDFLSMTGLSIYIDLCLTPDLIFFSLIISCCTL